jgi:hypothetical protein
VLVYLEVLERPNAHPTLLSRLRTLGRVRYHGVGTATRKQAGWFEIELPITELVEARQLLSDLRIVKVVEIVRGEGKILAMQLELFGAR